MENINWSLQHQGVQSIDQLVQLMPDLHVLLITFPENDNDFVWDVKVHMLMPVQ